MFKNLKDYGFNTSSRFYTIAEIGINHNGDLDSAKKLIDKAVESKCDAVKFQTYITEKRVPKNSPIFDILKQCEFSFDKFITLKDHAESLGVDFFSTPFDNESIEFLDEINCEILKVASFDVTNHNFLRKISQKNKTMIISTGMSNIKEVKAAYDILTSSNKKLALLHCVSSYPTNPCDSNLLAINSLRNNFDCVIGQSDHTPNISVPLYAAAMGAQVLEKHFMINDDCVDACVSIDPHAMLKLNNSLQELDSIMGSGKVSLTETQKGALQFRRKSE